MASFSRRTGSELGLFATQQNKGDIVVRLKARGERQRASDAIIQDLRARIAEAVAGFDVEFVQLLQDMIGDLNGNPEPIEVKVFGDDQQTLERLAEQIEPVLHEVRGVVDVVGVQKGNPDVTWTIDPVAAGRLGLTVAAVAEQLQAAGLGEIATELQLPDRTIPVRVRYPDAVRFDPRRLAEAAVRGTDGRAVAFSARRPALGGRAREHPDAREPAPDGARHRAARGAGPRRRRLGAAPAPRRRAAASGLHPGGRRPARGAEPGVPRAAHRARRSPPRWCS